MSDGAPLAIKRFLDMYVEVLNEQRPLRHLLTYATDEAFRAIQLGVARRGRRTWWPAGSRPGTKSAHPAPRSAGSPPLQPHPVPIRVQRVRSCQPADSVVEVTAVLRRGEEVRALAVRLERHHDRWTCTALEFVG